MTFPNSFDDIKNEVYKRMKEMEYKSEQDGSKLDSNHELLCDVYKILKNLSDFTKTL